MSFYILLCAGVFGAVISLVIAGHLALQKRAAAMRFLLGNLSLTTLASYKEDVDRQYFLEFMLEKMGYVDHTVITLVNAAFDKLDVDGTTRTDDLTETLPHEGLQLPQRRRDVLPTPILFRPIVQRVNELAIEAHLENLAIAAFANKS